MKGVLLRDALLPNLMSGAVMVKEAV